MFERFTDRAIRTVDLAKEQARGLGHDHVGTEHLLLGFLTEGECVAAKALAALGVTEYQVSTLSVVARQPPQAAPMNALPFTPRLKKALELALREALQLGHPYIGTEHLLLGMARMDDSRAMRALGTLGVTGQQVRDAVLTVLRGYKPAAVPEPEPEEEDPVLRSILNRLDRIERHLGLPAL